MRKLVLGDQWMVRWGEGIQSRKLAPAIHNSVCDCKHEGAASLVMYLTKKPKGNIKSNGKAAQQGCLP